MKGWVWVQASHSLGNEAAPFVLATGRKKIALYKKWHPPSPAVGRVQCTFWYSGGGCNSMSCFPRGISTQQKISTLFFLLPFFTSWRYKTFFCAHKKFSPVLIRKCVKVHVSGHLKRILQTVFKKNSFSVCLYRRQQPPVYIWALIYQSGIEKVEIKNALLNICTNREQWVFVRQVHAVFMHVWGHFGLRNAPS